MLHFVYLRLLLVFMTRDKANIELFNLLNALNCREMSIIVVTDAENIENDNRAHHVTNERPLETALDVRSEHSRDFSEIALARAFFREGDVSREHEMRMSHQSS